ncbi:MAG: cysteine peptidase family C39 domain-containing protein [Candidatus Magnetobacterium sp. LHC-1]|nr:hypothetical protein [Nitrospirota bacterium]
MSELFLGLNIFFMMIFALSGYMKGRLIIAKHPDATIENIHKKMRNFFIVAILLIVIAIAIKVIDKMGSLIMIRPVWFDRYSIYIIFIILGGLVSYFFNIAVAIAYKTVHRERNKISIATLLVILTIPIIQWGYTKPIHSTLTERSANGFILQSSGASCVCATGANIAGVLGIKTTEKELAKLMNTTGTGTNYGNAIYGMKQIGIACKKIYIKDSNIRLVKPPAFVSVDHIAAGSEAHSVAFMGLVDDLVEIWDPLVGKRQYIKESDVLRFWHGRGLECQKTTI